MRHASLKLYQYTFALNRAQRQLNEHSPLLWDDWATDGFVHRNERGFDDPEGKPLPFADNPRDYWDALLNCIREIASVV